ncbi:MAG: hypothetical protein GX301_06635 [Gracilibacteraceae bacterium]|nr:hypothetical protein [Gracilibacteraceae bacterium]
MVVIFINAKEAEDFVYSSYMKAINKIPKDMPDMMTRSPHLTRMLLDNAGEPDKKQRNVLVTGSKGKGSVSRMISKLIEAHGFKVGLCTSPHLVSFLERIRINGNAISEDDFVKYANILEPYAAEVQNQLTGVEYIGPVGITAVIAMLYYQDKKTDFNVFECGKGARFDDVTRIHSEASVINTVFLEHVPHLGYDLSEIAFNKVGIISSTQRFAVSAGQQREVRDVICKEARDKGVRLFIWGQDFSCENICIDRNGTYFDVITRNGKYSNIRLNLMGRHQAYNAAIAICTAENLLGGIKEENIKQAYGGITWPGRLEVINRSPLTILDGCINKECARHVREVVNEMGNMDVVSIIGIPDDKDYEGVVCEMSEISRRIILTTSKNKYLRFKKTQIDKVKLMVGEKLIYKSEIEDAVETAYNLIKGDELVCIIGTQSLVRDVKEYFKQDTLNL